MLQITVMSKYMNNLIYKKITYNDYHNFVISFLILLSIIFNVLLDSFAIKYQNFFLESMPWQLRLNHGMYGLNNFNLERKFLFNFVIY